MEHVHISRDNEIAVVTLDRGKVNPINRQVVDELTTAFESLAPDDGTSPIILTGTGKFFSFGLDVPELYDYPRDDFKQFLIAFTDLYRLIFRHSCPVIAAVNGHAIAGGCMLAAACDYRVIVDTGARIGLNEVTFGSSVFAGTTEILKHFTGGRNAERILLSGTMYSAREAEALGLVDEVVAGEDLFDRARTVATEFAAGDGAAFSSIKKLLRQDILARIEHWEMTSIEEFVEIWYSDSTREQTKGIIIRE